jgi:hypothetical protein
VTLPFPFVRPRFARMPAPDTLTVAPATGLFVGFETVTTTRVQRLRRAGRLTDTFSRCAMSIRPAVVQSPTFCALSRAATRQ